MTQQRSLIHIPGAVSAYFIVDIWKEHKRQGWKGGEDEGQRGTKNKDGKRVGNPLRPTDGDTKEYQQKGTRWRGEGRTTWKGQRKEQKDKMDEVRYCQSSGSASFSSPPPLPPFSYGNPSSSSELLGSSINQRLYEIPAGAKGQRRKLAAVFSSPFMLAAGLIAKCAISLISTLKQTPRQAGEELFARSYILWHQILF